MAQAKTKIQWTQRTWNPVRGCRHASPGCLNCYAEKIAARFSGPDQPFHLFAKREPKAHWTGKMGLVWDKLTEPLSWREPSVVFANSMSDLFQEDLPDQAIDRVFTILLACATLDMPRHTFQILTKRADRMLAYFSDRSPEELVKAWADGGNGLVVMDNEDVLFSEYVMGTTCHDWDENGTNSSGSEYHPWGYLGKVFPLPNVWLGVSVENQEWADRRLLQLMQTPAAIRFASYEPALGAVDFRHFLSPGHLTPGRHVKVGERKNDWITDVDGGHFSWRGLDWLIAGGESGPGARPCSVEWIRSAVEQCAAAKVPCFVKQLGAKAYHAPEPLHPESCVRFKTKDPKGGTPEEWPEDLHVRQFPGAAR